jgi:glucose-6-phosphate-specific signal transduction histidine kinase
MEGIIKGAWWRQGAVVVGYALAYCALREISFSYWVLLAGFRLATLLFIPQRYWAALIAGELIPLGYLAISCADSYGWVWAVVTVALSPIALAMPVVHWCKQTLRMLPVRGGVRMGALLVCSVLVASAWTLDNWAGLAVTRLPVGYHFEAGPVLARWFIGNFLGVLTVVPVALLIRDAWRSTSTGNRWLRLLDSRLAMEATFLLVPALGLLLWIAAHAGAESSHEAARMAMFLPVVFLALRHGWQGAALGGTLASVAEVLSMAGPKDAGALQAETFIAFAITTMLLMGSRISVLNERDTAERIQVQEALVLARRNIHIGEARLRVAAEFLEQIRDMVHLGYERMLAQLKHLPAVESRGYARQAAAVQENLFRLSDGLYPAGWRDKDLMVALTQGALARALDEAGVSYWCESQGDFSSASSELHLAIYRLIGECLTLACQDMPPTHIRVRLRAGEHCGQAWVGMRIKAWTERDCVAAVRLDDVRIRLGSAGLNWSAAEDRVRSYQGRLRHARRADTDVVSAVMLDPHGSTRNSHDRLTWPAAGASIS